MPLTRREFLKGVGLAVGGLGMTAGGYERLIPYVNQPEDIVPGVSTWYATSCRECPAGCGMIVRNRDSRAVKCEGNPLHPISEGRLCARGQAALMGLYDPDRPRTAMRRDESGKLVETNWDDALKAVGKVLAKRGRVAFLSDLQTGSLEALISLWLNAIGSDRLVTWEPLDYSAVKAVFGVVPTFDIASSDYLISFGADFLENWISPVEYARGFAEMRKLRDGVRAGFAYIGPRVSATAASADIRIIVPPGAEVEIARAIASGKVNETATRYGIDAADIKRVADDLKRAKSPLILPGWYAESAEAVKILGGDKSPAVHRNRPHAVTGIGGRDQIEALIKDMESGSIDALFVLNANPVFALPDSARFADALKRVPTVVSLSSFMDETAALTHWVLPSSTALESWGDAQPYPDVANLMQPAMGNVFDTRQTGDILIELAREAKADLKAESFYAFLRSRWGFPLSPEATADTPAPEWEALLERGWGKLRVTSYELRVGEGTSPPTLSSSGIRLYAFPHTYYYDGRGANRRWLQEIPEPVTNAVWGTWAEIHPKTANELGVGMNDLIEIEAGDAKITVPAYVWDGVAPGTVAVPIGEGHTNYGQFASGIGANVYPLLSSPNPEVKARGTGGSQWVTRIKGSSDQHGREIVQTAQLGTPIEREREIIMPLKSGYKKWDFYPGTDYKKHRWAMVVDLDKCIGCHACVTACYAENNLGMVGAEGIYRRREMSWVRIDRYISSPVGQGHDVPAQPRILFQPMLCQHCDAAPCEPVCPVFASSHSDEGLNMQVYNRCVGTRYCSHNCPYKVRRFNWFDYQWPEPLNWQLNPDVTVRSRGVMEKCTFCIQRIREAEIIALRENRRVEDGEITPACAQTCPTGVYTFGDLMDKNSRVRALFDHDPRAYQVLAELNTKPAVIYLKRLTAQS